MSTRLSKELGFLCGGSNHSRQVRDNPAYVARQYWVEGGQMHCLSDNGEEKLVALEEIDLTRTVRLNGERRVKFMVQSRDMIEQ